MAEGMAPLVRLFERRLRRPLTEAEHAILRERWTTMGPRRLVDLALDLTSEVLGRWLAYSEAEYTLVDSDCDIDEAPILHPGGSVENKVLFFDPCTGQVRVRDLDTDDG